MKKIWNGEENECYYVVYNANGGIGTPSNQTGIYGNSLTLSSMIPTRIGYDFIGWSKSATDITVSYQGGDEYTENTSITLYAVWKKTVTVTFKYYDGTKTETNTISRVIYNNEKANIGVPNVPNITKDGVTYLLRGWSTKDSANATIQVEKGKNASLTEDTTYYASYSSEITATFYYHGGTDPYATTQSSATASATKYMDFTGFYLESNLTIPETVTKSTNYNGTVYKGVATSTNSSTAVTPTTKNNIYYAFYDCTITYYYYDGSTHTSSTATRRGQSDGSKYVCTVDSTPTPSSYDEATFKWWSYDATQSSYKIEPNATAATSLYAVYEKSITATFHYYDGSGATKTTASAIRSYISKSGGVNTYNTDIVIPATVSGSSGAASTTYSHVATSKTGSSVTPTTATTTYYAVYKKTVTVTKYVYNNQSSKVTGTAYGYYDGTTANATINLGTTTLSGYVFRGWSTSTSAKATISVVQNGSVELLEDDSYYASYTYTIKTSYNVNRGSSTTPETQSSTGYMNYIGTKVGTAITLAEAPTRVNYIFNGWYSAATGGTKRGNAGASYSPTASETLYAQWTAANYSVNTSPVTYTLTLQEAISAANTGSTIKVLKDVTDSSTATVNKNLTLSTNSYTLTRTAKITVNSGYTLTLTGTGMLKGTANDYLINNNGTLKITHTGTLSYQATKTEGRAIRNNGTLTITSAVTVTSTTTIFSNQKSGTITLSGGTYTASGSLADAVIKNIEGGKVTIGSKVTINCTKMRSGYTNGIIVNLGDLTINGGKIYSSDNSFKGSVIVTKGKMTMTAGTINTGTGGMYGIQNLGTATDKTVSISGGSVYGKEAGLYHASVANITIQNATIKGDVGGATVEKGSAGSTFTINGTAQIVSDKGTGLYILDEANVTLRGGKVIGAQYGVHSNITTANLLQIGINGDDFSETKIIILGKAEYGVHLDDTSFKFYFKNGKILGGKGAYVGTPNGKRTGYSYYTGNGTYDGVTYKKASLKAN